MTLPRWARGVCDGFEACGIQHVVYVPDNPLASVLAVLGGEHPRIDTTLATREEEAVGIAAGLHLGGVRAAVMLQSSGLGNAVNALASLVSPYQIPLLLLISMRGDAGEWNAAQVPMGRAVPRILEALGVPYEVAAAPDDVGPVVERIGRTAFDTRQTGACLLPRRITAPRTGEETR